MRGTERINLRAFGPQILRSRGLWPKGPEDQGFAGQSFVELQFRMFSLGMISGFCSTDLLTA